MIKSELIERIANKNPHLYHRDAERIVQTILDEVIRTLANGGRVELRGFGAFTTRLRAPRAGRNPRTGKAVTVPAKIVPHFKAGKELHKKLNSPLRQVSTLHQGSEQEAYT